MRNLKKFLALVLAMMMALSLMVTANAQNAKKEYQDVADAEFTEAIDVLTGMGVFKGSDGDFRPTETITRAEAAAVLYRLVTGDVEDKQVDLYAPQAYRFSDVTADKWYAGYVGFAVDAGFVKGYDGQFAPDRKVTGYEMLAMLLRAVGYGKNGEFTGDSWRINVGARAQSLGILDTIESTHYASTLSQGSAREVVAELTFVTATTVPTVTWTQLGGYNQYKALLTTDDSALNDNLGVKVFKLTPDTGIIVGNQETGEDKTIVNTMADDTTGYEYPAAPSEEETEADEPAATFENLDIKTGLELYGHKVKVWYKNSGDTKHAYAVIDQATSETKYASKASIAYQDIAKTEDNVYVSVKYGTFGDAAKAKGTALDTDESPIKMYTVIDNDKNGKADAIIVLNAEVAKVTETKTTAKPQTISLATGANGNKKASGFKSNAETPAEGTLVVSGDDNQVIGDFDITTALGKVFTVWEVTGTNPASDAEGVSYAVLKTPLKTVTGTVSTYTVAGELVTSVNVVGGDKIERSGILEGEQAIAYYGADDGPKTADIKAGVTYTFTLDEAGRFVNISSPSEYSFLYATYADFQYGAMGTGDIEYKVYGIDWNGLNVNDHDLVYMELKPVVEDSDDAPGGDAEEPAALHEYPSDDNGTLGDGYEKELATTRKNMAGNGIKDGVNTAFMIDTKGNMIQKIDDGSVQFETGTWTITSKDASNGFAKVEVTAADDDEGAEEVESLSDEAGVKYMLTNDTVFYVVSGFGINAKVTPYNGLKDLVGSSTGVKITAGLGMDEVWFQTGDDKFDSVETGDNKPITKMILSIDNLDWYSNENLYFAPKGIEASDVKLASVSGVNQYELWLNGVKGTYWIKEEATAIQTACAEGSAFYTLAKVDEKNGVTIYAATKLDASHDPKMATPDVGGVCNAADDLTYKYILVNNYSKAKIGDDILNVAGAVVADVQFDMMDIEDRIEIDTVRKLNNAVSTGYTITVAIVNNGIDVSTIYVVSDGVNLPAADEITE